MAAKSPIRRRVAGSIGIIERHHGPDDPRLPDLRRDLRAAELEEHVRRIVDATPPLTPEQRDKIAALLFSGRTSDDRGRAA
jgi:hypothetical protein